MRVEKNIKQYLEGTKYEKYIPNFYQKGISEMEEILELKRNGNLIQTLNEIIENKEDIVGLKDLLYTCLNKEGFKKMGIFFIPVILIIITIFIVAALR